MALLVYADTDGVERSVTVGAEPVTVGRATECAIRSSDPRVSRNHARFFLDATSGMLHVEDLGSSNGVYVGQNKVQHSAVQANEIVLIGSLTFRLVSQAAMPPPAYQNVEWAQPATQPSSAAYQQPHQAWGQQPGMPPPQAQWGGAMAPAPAMPPPHAAPPAMPPPQAAPPAMSPQQPWGVPAAPPQEPTAWSTPPAEPPAVSDAPPSIDVSGAIEEERKARVAAEEERDAYGARMAELHGELRTLRASLEQHQQALAAAQQTPQQDAGSQQAIAVLQQQLAATQQAHEATKAELAKARIPAGDGPLQQRIAELTAEKDQLVDELEGTKVRLTEAEDHAKSAEARFRSADEELTVARQDLAAAEERIVSEIAAHEQRSAAELTSRVEELEVTRADLIKAEERIVELTRKLSELEEKLGRF